MAVKLACNDVVERATKETVRSTGRRELAYVAERMGAEQGTGSIVRSAIASIAKISWFAPFGMGFAERFVNRSLAQAMSQGKRSAGEEPAIAA
jgi:hypothetical protein